MIYLRVIFLFTVLASGSYTQSHAQAEAEIDEYEYVYDTNFANPFEGADSFNFKLDYYNTEGISTGDRYWYEVIVLDTLLILNFKSPASDSWNYISYQKRMIISDSALHAIKRSSKTFGIKQKRKGIPHWQGSGYGANRLFIESKDVHIAGGMVFMAIGNDTSLASYRKRIMTEKKQSSSISGNYEKFFKQLEGFFVTLPQLLKDSSKE
jgi:hypothetical protein